MCPPVDVATTSVLGPVQESQRRTFRSNIENMLGPNIHGTRSRTSTSGSWCAFSNSSTLFPSRSVAVREGVSERLFFIDNLLVRIHVIIGMILVERHRDLGI